MTATNESTNAVLTDRKIQMCEYCGLPMYVGVGKMHEVINPKTKQVQIDINTGRPEMIQAKDSDARWHKHCRKLGRRQEYLLKKKGLKNASQKAS